jgi:hypothetical protein
MKRIPLLVLPFIVAAVGCSSDSNDAPDDEPRRETAIEALTRAMKFERGETDQGGIATFDPSLGSVSLLPDEMQLDLAGGVASLVGFEVEGLADGDEVAATLLEFEDAEEHIRVPVENGGDAGAGSSQIENPFTVDDDVCDYLCNQVFTVQLSFAIELADGKVSPKRSITLELDCRDDGDEALCGAGDGDGDGDGGGVGDGGGDGDGDIADAGEDSGSSADAGAPVQPVVTSIAPSTLTAGQATTLQIIGSGFDPEAQAYLDGVALPTTVLSGTLIEIEVPASSSFAGSLAVTVENIAGMPSTQGNVLYVQVTPVPGAPLIYDYSPDNGVAGDTILIIASNLAGQTLTIEDAEGNELVPGTLGTIVWPTVGTVDTVTVELPDDIATGPITVSNTIGSYRGKIFSVGLNLTRAEGTVVDASSEFNTSNWSKVSGADNLLATSFFTAVGDCATVTTCTTVPFYSITLAEDQEVGRIAMRGNREYASGYDFIRGTFQLLDAAGDVVWEGDYDLPAPDRDLDITLAEPVTARALRFESLEDESVEPGFAELELFGP